RLVPGGSAPGARALPDAPARPGAARAGRAVQRARRGGRRAARPRAGRAPADRDLRRLDPRSGANRRAGVPAAGLWMSAYLADVATLAPKDLRLERRVRSVVPSMLLFVVSALVVFHFALPSGSSDLAAKGLLWVAIIFTALLGLTRAFVAEREQRLLDGLLLAPCDRSAIWLGETVSMLRFLVFAELVALPAFALFFSGIDGATVAGVALANLGICAVGTVLAAMAVAGRAGERLLPRLFLPLAIPIVIGGVGASVVDEPARYLGFLALYDAVFAIISWASFEYVVTE